MAGALGQHSYVGYLGRLCRGILHRGLGSISGSQRYIPRRVQTYSSKSDGKPKKEFKGFKPASNYCRQCGGKMESTVPPGDDKERDTCCACGYVDYFNPKMVVGCIVEHEGKILLCKRGIEPCKGMWTVPAGYMEMNESSQDGAVRETAEEANAKVQVLSPHSHMDIPIISQTYLLFRAKLLPPFEFSPGPETLEVNLFKPQDIPFDEIAFSTVSIALRHYLEDMESGNFHIHHGEITKVPGSSPYDPRNFTIKNHFIITAADVLREKSTSPR